MRGVNAEFVDIRSTTFESVLYEYRSMLGLALVDDCSLHNELK